MIIYLLNLIFKKLNFKKNFGAGEGNRTLTASLEGWNSTVELHPHNYLKLIFK